MGELVALADLQLVKHEVLMGVPLGEDVHILLGSWYCLGSLMGDNWQRILLQSLTTLFSGLFHIGTMETAPVTPMLIDKKATQGSNYLLGVLKTR